jgi:beta-lactamase class D
MPLSNTYRYVALLIVLCCFSSAMFGATRKKRAAAPQKANTKKARAVAAANRRTVARRAVSVSHRSRLNASRHAPLSHAARIRARRLLWNPWTEPTFADSTSADFIDGEDLVVRRAAVEALGPYNGTVVVADPNTGRILTMVNQKLALKGGFQPCSTIKIVAALAALNEGIIERETPLKLYGRVHMGLTEALARSNNTYFARIGETLGFQKINYYARLYGLGEKAGLDIPGEEPGLLPSGIPEPGMGMMTSFGSGIALTPLELTSLMVSIANGGTMYYLQYPRSREAASKLVPRVKRRLDIAQWIPEVKPGMMGAVEFGTARRANYASTEPILGKTGTCTDSHSPTHLGWFGSYNDIGKNKLVVTVLLTGGRGVNGPIASGIAGQVYNNLSKVNYFQQDRLLSPIAMVGTGNCCFALTEN